MPAVSVVVTTYNRAKLIGECVESVQAQTMPDWEMVVVDDCSKDDTASVMAGLCADPRIRYIRQEKNRGAQAARNLGIAESSGEFVNILDSDDLFAPGKLEKQLVLLRADEEADLAVCQMASFREEPGDLDTLWNTFAGDEPLTRFLRHDPVWGIHAPLWRRSALDRFGPFDQAIPVAQDYEYHTKALCLGARPILSSEVLCYVRAHEGSTFKRTKAIVRFETLHKLFLEFEHILTERGELTPERREELAKDCLWASMYLARLGPVGSWRPGLRSFMRISENPAKSKAPYIGELLSMLLGTTRRDRVFRALRKHYESIVGPFAPRDSWDGKHKVVDEP